ncbi:hypothetical protein PaeCFBP13512_10415 [Paenibacillus sp. CFBP13512]|uniref:hypothetical protein n=1 Tax=Paenibacillus sp. CFBP13512 TaxID=2184007 RepID=UPI0010C07A5E|nr:hypothetical protein [Paenibacillus sp. CFBP13512]TKJ91731.1 hypothetical protein PaeCFBP13512_10415 [Paenibacillus sp. CFBP13512]
MNNKPNQAFNQDIYTMVEKHMMYWNPMNLIEWCLPDEYSIEIDHIVKILPYMKSAEELGNQVYWIMQKYFGSHFARSTEECYHIADKIYKNLEYINSLNTSFVSFNLYFNSFKGIRRD